LALWNALPGVEKRRKVGDRDALIDQLWSALEALPEPEPQSDAKRPSKQDAVIAMLRRPEGATVDEVAGATGWQRHTVRGGVLGNPEEEARAHTRFGQRGTRRVYHIAEPASISGKHMKPPSHDAWARQHACEPSVSGRESEPQPPLGSAQAGRDGRHEAKNGLLSGRDKCTTTRVLGRSNSICAIKVSARPRKTCPLSRAIAV